MISVCPCTCELFDCLRQPERVDRVLEDGTTGNDPGIRDGKGTICLDLAIVDTATALCHARALVDNQCGVGLIDRRQNDIGKKAGQADSDNDHGHNDPETTVKNAQNVCETKCVFHVGSPLFKLLHYRGLRADLS
jgi:hypothetical protein